MNAVRTVLDRAGQAGQENIKQALTKLPKLNLSWGRGAAARADARRAPRRGRWWMGMFTVKKQIRNQKTQEQTMRKLNETSRTRLVTLAALCLSATLASADTFHSGNVSGTWTKTGNRHIIQNNCEVPPGETLIIHPGVVVIIGQGKRIEVQGRIVAEGTAAERITFCGANSSLYWDTIQVNYSSIGDSSFINCDFTEATNALSLYCTIEYVMAPQVFNCTFSNTVNTCIYGEASFTGTVAGEIKSCKFLGGSNGVHLVTGVGVIDGWGFMNATVANNHFESLSGSAMRFDLVHVNNSNPKFINNTIRQCSTGVRKVGSSPNFNDEVAYNCLFNNETNFEGFPSGIHGTICCVNANGTPCDLLNNIFTDPLFCETTNYTLSASSPCIDAGNPDSAYLDNCLTNACYRGSLGTTVNDIGIWGGPDACRAINPPPNTFPLKARPYAGVTITPSTPGHYRLEYIDSFANPPATNGPWTQATNLWLLSTPWTWIDYNTPTTGKRFYRGVLLP